MREQVRAQMQAAGEALRAEVRERWGADEVRTADRTTYVKYTHGYASRVITDFAVGTLQAETLDETNPRTSLETAITTALLTSDDLGVVDLFSDKEVGTLTDRPAYLDGLVQDEHGRSIGTESQARQFARYLVSRRLQTRSAATAQGSRAIRFVVIPLVSDFEYAGARHYQASVRTYAEKWGISATLVLAIMQAESHFNPFAVSAIPTLGLMQLAPSSALYGIYKQIPSSKGVLDVRYIAYPERNIEMGAALLGQLGTAGFGAISNPEARDLCVIAAYKIGAHQVMQVFDRDTQAALAHINSLDPSAVLERLRTALPSEDSRQYVVAVASYRTQLAARGFN
jgi:membrane-bound lytic murein transglycosylase C